MTIDNIIGRWPGDETDAEIAAAMREPRPLTWTTERPKAIAPYWVEWDNGERTRETAFFDGDYMQTIFEGSCGLENFSRFAGPIAKPREP